MSGLDAYLDEARLPGRHESSGQFSLAYQQACQTLGSFQRHWPNWFLWKFVQAAVAAGAREVRLWEGRRGLRLRALGGRWRPSDLERLEGDLLGARLSGDQEPLHYLAAALGAGLSLNPPRLSLSFVVGRRRHALSYQRSSRGYGSQREQGPTPQEPGCELELVGAGLGSTFHRLSLAPVRLVVRHWLWGSQSVLNGLEGVRPLAEIHRGPARGSGLLFANPVAAWIDRSQPRQPGEIVLRCEQGRVTRRVRVGRGEPPVARLVVLVYGGRVRSTRVTLVKFGLELDALQVEWGLPGVDVFVEADDAAVDLSGLKPVRTDALKARLVDLRSEVREALVEAVQRARDELRELGEAQRVASRFRERLGQGVCVGGVVAGVATLNPLPAVVGLALGGRLWNQGVRLAEVVERLRRLERVLEQSVGL